MNNLKFEKIDNKKYSINDIEFNYSSYIESEREKVTKIISDYKFDSSCLKLDEMEKVPESEVIRVKERIKYLDSNINLLNDFLNLMYDDEVNILKLVHLVTKREYKDINNVRNELKAFNNQELMKTYESILNYEELAKIHGSLTIESNNCHSFINTIEKRA